MMPPRALLAVLAFVSLFGSGCTLAPHVLHQPQYHNPWPQLRKVAIAPFFNLSENPTVNQDDFAQAYFNELQQVPGFEVIPIGVTRQAMAMHNIRGASAAEFQRLARLMGVDAVVVGTVNDFSPYYPPRLAMTVNWYAANPGFHPMPNGYGLPWGRAEEEFIPDTLVEAAEFELATAQLATQTPVVPSELGDGTVDEASSRDQSTKRLPVRSASQQSIVEQDEAEVASESIGAGEVIEFPPGASANGAQGANAPAAIAPPVAVGLPPDWPDPRGFIPPPPQAVRPQAAPYNGPIITHTRGFNGNDADFTEAMASYYEFRDEARFGGWQNYLQRSEDFIRFCCYMHIAEMLSARGGARETKVVHRWPFSRYER